MKNKAPKTKQRTDKAFALCGVSVAKRKVCAHKPKYLEAVMGEGVLCTNCYTLIKQT